MVDTVHFFVDDRKEMFTRNGQSELEWGQEQRSAYKRASDQFWVAQVPATNSLTRGRSEVPHGSHETAWCGSEEHECEGEC